MSRFARLMATNQPNWDDMSRDEIKAEIKRLKRRATRKVARLKRENNASIAGSKRDPRRDDKAVGRYTHKQLKGYAETLQKFNSRNTQFHGTSNGTIIPEHKWKNYKKEERKNARKVDSFYGSVKNFKDHRGIKIEDQMRIRSVSRKRPGTAVHSWYEPTIRNSKSIASVPALEELTDALKRKNAKTNGKKLVRSYRNQVREALKGFGPVADEIIKNVDSLTDAQMFVLANYTSFMDDVTLPYHMNLNGNTSQGFVNVSETSLGLALDASKWAKKFKTTRLANYDIFL